MNDKVIRPSATKFLPFVVFEPQKINVPGVVNPEIVETPLLIETTPIIEIEVHETQVVIVNDNYY